jgi:hypothetical protein
MLVITNIYIVYKMEDFQAKEQRWPAKTLINKRIIKKVFKDKYIKELRIPC